MPEALRETVAEVLHQQALGDRVEGGAQLGVRGAADVLLHEDDGGAGLADAGKGRVDVADDDGGETEADLVAEEDFGVGHEGAADGHHLLLAAGERGAGHPALFAQDREEVVDRVE